MSKEGWSLLNTQSIVWLQPARASSGKWHYSFIGNKEYFSLHTGAEIKAIIVTPIMFFFNNKVKPAKSIADHFNI